MSESQKDTIFHIDKVEEDFVFNDRVVEVFDDMLDRSIPCYREVIEASAQLLDKFLVDTDTIYDLGCATGTSLLDFRKLLQHKELHFIGIDNSRPMLEKARLKTELHSQQEHVSFLFEDIMEFAHLEAGGIILNYTLQFIRPMEREAFLRRLFSHLRPGGVLLLSEKIISHAPRLNREYIAIYHQFKREKGYSDLEIAQKREALENVLIPFSIDENKAILKKCGFETVESYFQWFNFTSFIAVKPNKGAVRE